MNDLLIPKEHPEIPDYWTITITYWDKTVETFDIVNHNMSNGIFSFWTAKPKNRHHWRMQDKIKGIDFDDNFSKYMELKEEKKKDGG